MVSKQLLSNGWMGIGDLVYIAKNRKQHQHDNNSSNNKLPTTNKQTNIKDTKSSKDPKTPQATASKMHNKMKHKYSWPLPTYQLWPFSFSPKIPPKTLNGVPKMNLPGFPGSRVLWKFYRNLSFSGIALPIPISDLGSPFSAFGGEMELICWAALKYIVQCKMKLHQQNHKQTKDNNGLPDCVESVRSVGRAMLWGGVPWNRRPLPSDTNYYLRKIILK